MQVQRERIRNVPTCCKGYVESSDGERCIRKCTLLFHYIDHWVVNYFLCRSIYLSVIGVTRGRVYILMTVSINRVSPRKRFTDKTCGWLIVVTQKCLLGGINTLQHRNRTIEQRLTWEEYILRWRAETVRRLNGQIDGANLRLQRLCGCQRWTEHD